MSRTPTTLPFLCSGITISEFEALSQAMWPLNSWTFGTSWVSPLAAAVPQTPLPQGMTTQAGRP